MGLRIGSSAGVLTALRNLRAAGAGEDRALERIATGLQINRAEDNPSGLVLSERLRSQLSALSQAVDNNENARGLAATADAALETVSGLLSRARALTVAAGNEGVLDPDQRTALQNALDQTVAAIDRIGGTTRFGGQGLLNGNFEFVTQNVNPAFADIRLFGADLADGLPLTVSVDVVAGAAQAQASGTIAAVQGGDSTVRVGGPLGSRDVTLAAGQTDDQVAQAINEATGFTGIEVAGPPGARVIRSVDFGAAAFVNVQELSGDLQGIAPGVTTGADVQAVVNGQAATGRGNTLDVVNGVTGEITLQPGTGPGTYAFEIAGGGASFQIGAEPVAADRVTVGIPAVSGSRLGASSGVGTLSSVATGGANDLFTQPGNANRIFSAAVNEVTQLRGALGAVSSKIFEANTSALEVHFENILGAESALRDADVARELAARERFAALRAAGIDILRNTNLTSGAVLRLLL